MNRRQFAAAGGAALAAAWFPRASPGSAPMRWAPYADTIAIDARGGFGRMRADNEERAFNAQELADARDSGLSGVVLTLAPQGAFWFDEAAFQRTLQEFDYWDGKLRDHPDTFTAIRTGADLARAHQEGKVGLIYSFQETSPIGEDLERVDMFRERGVRVIQLTHNRRNLVGDGCMEPGNAGLSSFGHQVIERLNERRILVDLSHGGRRTIREAIAACKAPMIIGHTGCAALSDVPRTVPDDSLRAMADKGGVAGIIFWPYLRKAGQPMAEDVIRHIEHAIDVCGEDHVGIGTDATVSPIELTPENRKNLREWSQSLIEQGIFEKGRSGQLYPFIPDLNHARRYETLGAMLAARGHSDGRIDKVLGGNFVRVMTGIWG